MLINKYFDDPDLSGTCLKILASCLRELPEESIALKIASSGIIESLFRIHDEAKKSENDKEVALEILDKVLCFPKSHEILISKNILAFIGKKFDQFLNKQPSQLKQNDLKELTRLFYITTSLAKNNAIAEDLSASKILDKMINVYNIDKEVSFLSDLYIKSLYDISSNYQGVLTLKSLKINLKELVTNAISSKNKNLIEYTEKIIYNLMSREELEQTIQSIKSNNASFENLAFLAFTSYNEMMSDLVEDQELIEIVIRLLNDATLTEDKKFTIVKYLGALARLEEKHTRYFESHNVMPQIVNFLNSQDNFIFLAEIMELLTNMLSSGGQATADIFNKNEIILKILNLTTSLSKILEDFSKRALTMTKALDSIEFHKSETTRIILETMKTIKPNELVPLKIALDYISCEHYSVSVFILLSSYAEKCNSTKLQMSESVINTCSALMKVFKNSKRVHQQIFDTLSKSRFPTEVANHIVLVLNWPFVLSDLVWKKLNWKYFALYVLRFIEIIMSDEVVLRNLKKGVNTIKLVASIKHFISEEDYKDFEEQSIGTEGEEEAVREPPDQLKFAEEREIHKKGIALLEKLIDTASLQTFKTNIDRNIKSFKPKPEIIQILRAEYAVMTSVNGINYFGNEGLKGGLHKILQENIEELEKSVGRRDFPDKEKLLADCVRSIANFVCITWNEAGKNMYEKHEVSVIVFKLFEKYLKESKSPLASYIMLKAFKEWLINRIEIIENASNAEREKIYDPESFMMVPLQKKEQTIVDVLDSLYLTYQKFSTNEKVVNLNFEVITLLGYVYPQWKSRVAKNFIPQILDALEADNLGKESDFKSIELLKQLTGTDDKSEEANKEALEAAANNNAIEKICKSISDNEYDQKYINHCRPLLEALGSDVQRTQKNIEAVESLISKVQQFNKMPPSEKLSVESLKNVLKLNDNLNALCLVDTLRKCALEKGHTDAIGDLWGFLNSVPKENLSKEQEQLLDKIEKSCMIATNQHLPEVEAGSDGVNKLFGDSGKVRLAPGSSNILVNALKSLQRNKNNPQAVMLNSKIINSCFPGSHGKAVRQIAQEIKFQPDLDYIFKSYGSGDDKDLAQETTNLYVNLSENQDDDMMDKIIKKDLRKLKQDLNNENAAGIEDSLDSLIPLISHPVFSQKFEEFDILDYILRTLKFLHKKCKDKLNKTSGDLLNDVLGSADIPDLGPNNRKLMADEMKIAKSLCNFINGLSEPLKEKVRDHDEIVKLSDVAFILNANFSSYDILENYLKSPKAKTILNQNKAVEAVTFILMKANKDSFKVLEAPENEDLGRSTLTNLGRSALAVGKQKVNLAKSQIDKSALIIASQLPMPEETKPNAAEQSKEEFLSQNFDKFSNLMDKLITPEITNDIIEEYIKALNTYNSKNEESQSNLFAKSRLMACLMQKQKGSIDLTNYADRLKKAFENFLDSTNSEAAPNKKLFRFFDNILFKGAKNLNGKPKELRSRDLWNKYLDKYFVTSPALSKGNPKKVLKNLTLLKPAGQSLNTFKDLFEEKSGEFIIQSDFGSVNLFTEKNMNNIEKILANFARVLGPDAPDSLMLDNLESFTQSKTACKAIINNPLMDQLGHMITFYSDFDDLKKFKHLSNALINCLAVASTDEKVKAQVNSKIHPSNLMNVFIDNIENNREPFLPKSFEALKFLYEFVPNKNIVFERKLPAMLLNYVGSPAEWTPDKAPALLLLGRTLGDPSLEQQIQPEGLYEKVFDELQETIIAPPQKIQNPKEIFKKLSELSADPATQKAEFCTFVLGELSKYPHYSSQIAHNEGKTNVFEMYDAFERIDNNGIIATKLIEATRNGVYALQEDTLDQYPDEIDSIIARIPAKIDKFNEFNLVPRYLREILDFFKKYKKDKIQKQPVTQPSLLVRMTETLAKSSIGNDNLDKKDDKKQLKDTKDLSQIYKYICDQLEAGPLSTDDAKLYEIANEEVKGILENPGSQSAFSLMNLDIPKYLRLIANSPNSTNIQKTDALILLNGFVANPDILDKMIESPFYVEKSAELIDKFSHLHPSIASLSKVERDPLFEDLKFMKALTDKAKGAEAALQCDSVDLPLINDLLDILKSNREDPGMKLKALEILMNLLKAKDNPALETQLLKDMPDLFNKNMDIYPIVCALTKLLGVLAQNSDDNKEKIVKSKHLDLVKEGLQRFPNGPLLQNNASFAVFELSNAYPASHPYILDCGILPPLAASFNNPNSDKELHENIGKAILQIGYGSPEKKAKLIKNGLIMGLVPLLIKYSSPESYDPDMCTIVLKCMANFSTIPQGIEYLLQDGVIPAFRNFFDKYKEELPLQNKLMMATVANLAYEPKTNVLEKIIQDKGLDLIVDTLKFYSLKKDPETTEVAIDALTHVSVDPKAVEYLAKTDVTDILVDLLRQQMNDNLVYKALRCLTKFSEHDVLAKRIMDKGGHAAAADIFKPYKDDMKNIFQALKLLTTLVDKYPNKIEDFVFAGIPEKIISSFNEEWP